MKRRNRLALVAVAAATVMVTTAVSGGSASANPAAGGGGGLPSHDPPSHVLVVLFDQMLPQYADEFNMPNFRMLRDGGANFNDAYLGYMGSETVIAHNVLMSGQDPKHMGWVDEAYRDRLSLLSPVKDQMWVTGELSYDQFGTLVQNKGYPKLADYLQKAEPGKKFIVVGQKGYAVESAASKSAWDTSDADIAVRFSSRSSDNPNDPCQIALGGRYRYPAGVNVPAYLLDPCGRYYVNSASSNTYGTIDQPPSWIYPLDGNRYVPGYDPSHLGGDTWVADAAMDMMQNEDWSGMFVTMGGIDKAGHMWGANSDVQSPPGSLDYQTHVQFAAENADVQLGLMIDKLKALDELDDTLIVLTADHGATYGKNFYGKNFAGAGDTNWYYGPDSLPTVYNDPSPSLQPLLDTGNVQFSYQSTSIQTWLKKNGWHKRVEALKAMRSLPGVIATYYRVGKHYQLCASNPMSASDRAWWKAHGQSIIDNMADANAPDIVGLLADKTSYGAYGDHGGASESVQRVPMVFWTSSMQADNTGAQFNTPDVMPTILKAMGIKQWYPTDGRAHSLNSGGHH